MTVSQLLPMQRVLILDANQRSALAATRALGKYGVQVFTADEFSDTLAANSKYSSNKLCYPSPSKDAGAFIQFLSDTIATHKIDILLPMTDISTELVLKNRSSLGNTCIPFPDFEAYEAASNKYELFKRAQDLDIPIPNTLFFETSEHALDASNTFTFPVVIKPFRSRVMRNGKCIHTSVKYAYSVTELKELIAKYDWLRDYPFMIQEFIHGDGQGIFVLFDHGKLVASFAHKRLREKPPSGGVSVLSKSVSVPKQMLEIAESLLKPLKWHGVAMVEFKVSKEGTPYLMEINGRFWGSLQLAIDAGVNFPVLLHRIGNGDTITKQPEYRNDIKCRWLLGDLDHLYLKLKAGADQYSVKEKFLSVCRFLLPFQPGMRYEINRLDDIKPFIFELRQYFK